MTDIAAPIARAQRITNLDTVRGVATLGILIMNAASFGLPGPAYFNLAYAGSENWLDWVAGLAGEVFIDQKTWRCFRCCSVQESWCLPTGPKRRAIGRRCSACGATLCFWASDWPISSFGSATFSPSMRCAPP